MNNGSEIILVSKCLGRKKINGKVVISFHFKGMYKENEIKYVYIKEKSLVKNFEFKADYILKLAQVEVESENLWGSCIYSKKILQ